MDEARIELASRIKQLELVELANEVQRRTDPAIAKAKTHLLNSRQEAREEISIVGGFLSARILAPGRQSQQAGRQACERLGRLATVTQASDPSTGPHPHARRLQRMVSARRPRAASRSCRRRSQGLRRDVGADAPQRDGYHEEERCAHRHGDRSSPACRPRPRDATRGRMALGLTQGESQAASSAWDCERRWNRSVARTRRSHPRRRHEDVMCIRGLRRDCITVACASGQRANTSLGRVPQVGSLTALARKLEAQGSTIVRSRRQGAMSRPGCRPRRDPSHTDSRPWETCV